MSRSRYYPGARAPSTGLADERARARDAYHRALVLEGPDEYQDTRGDWLPCERLDYVRSSHLHVIRARMLPPRRRRKMAPHVVSKRERRIRDFVRGLNGLPSVDGPATHVCLSCGGVVNFMAHECGGRD